MIVPSLLLVCAVLLYTALRNRLHLAFRLLAVLAIDFAITIVEFVFPVSIRGFSPKQISHAILTHAAESYMPVAVHVPHWPRNEDAII